MQIHDSFAVRSTRDTALLLLSYEYTSEPEMVHALVATSVVRSKRERCLRAACSVQFFVCCCCNH
jgi:hypothetical protein